MTTHARDIALRAFHTFWQAFVAALGVAYAASGLDVSQIVDLASAKKFLLALAVAALGALLSAVKSTIAALLADPGDWTAAPQPPAAP